jgi:hypothetical protein
MSVATVDSSLRPTSRAKDDASLTPTVARRRSRVATRTLETTDLDCCVGTSALSWIGCWQLTSVSSLAVPQLGSQLPSREALLVDSRGNTRVG